MASTYSFDIVSTYDPQELKNALDQTCREVAQRYDLKSTNSEIDEGDHEITIVSDSEYALQAIIDVLESKFVRRKLSLKILDWGEAEPAGGSRYRQSATLRDGIDETVAKQISKKIRDEHKKVAAQIQGDSVRVQSKKKDDLQEIIASLKEVDYPVDLQFVNYR